MRSVASTAGGVLSAALCLVAASGVLYARDSRHPLTASAARLMYLTSGKTADRVFLSFDALAADVYWIRAIQHYGRDRKSTRTADRFEFLEPLLDLTTTLDPHFNIAYRFGAIFLSTEPPNGPGRPDRAIALLEKGMIANPRRWQYAHDVGFIHYWYTGDFREAARWFEKAAAMPGAPNWIGPLAALTLAQGGDRAGARQIFRELLGADEQYIRAAAERALAQLDALDAIDDLQRQVEQFAATTGRYPTGWSELVGARWVPGIPVDPAGVPYAYEPSTHVVSLGPQSGLAPLPRALPR